MNEQHECMSDVALTEETVLQALESVLDPEVPVSIRQLGLIQGVHLDENEVSVALVPTMLACPGREVIAEEIRQRLSQLVGERRVVVTWETRVIWTPRRVTASGRQQLQRWGVVAREPTPHGVRCPYCGSYQTRLNNAFGAAVCKAQFSCSICGSAFDVLRGALRPAPAEATSQSGDGDGSVHD
jgi:ring-1,2-phenylacetyl-CoA epoxidase subunit PaaD